MDNNSYNGNQNLKQIGFTIEYTADNVKEILTCKDDPIYFIKTYCKIVSLDSESLIPFDLFPYQERFSNALQDNRRVLSMQPRQSGKCVFKNTKYKVKNKTTGEIHYVTAEEFHELAKKKL